MGVWLPNLLLRWIERSSALFSQSDSSSLIVRLSVGAVETSP